MIHIVDKYFSTSQTNDYMFILSTILTLVMRTRITPENLSFLTKTHRSNNNDIAIVKDYRS